MIDETPSSIKVWEKGKQGKNKAYMIEIGELPFEKKEASFAGRPRWRNLDKLHHAFFVDLFYQDHDELVGFCRNQIKENFEGVVNVFCAELACGDAVRRALRRGSGEWG
jgi:hypothetical protein